MLRWLLPPGLSFIPLAAAVVLAVLLGLTPRRATRGISVVATLAAASSAWVLAAHASPRPSWVTSIT